MEAKKQNLIYALLWAEESNRGNILSKIIFTFLYSALFACLIYLAVSDIAGALIFFVVFFILGLLLPKNLHKTKSSISRAVSLVSLLLLVFFTVIWTTDITIKVGAWLILFTIFLLEKVEKRYYISSNTSNHN